MNNQNYSINNLTIFVRKPILILPISLLIGSGGYLSSSVLGKKRSRQEANISSFYREDQRKRISDSNEGNNKKLIYNNKKHIPYMDTKLPNDIINLISSYLPPQRVGCSELNGCIYRQVICMFDTCIFCDEDIRSYKWLILTSAFRKIGLDLSLKRSILEISKDFYKSVYKKVSVLYLNLDNQREEKNRNFKSKIAKKGIPSINTSKNTIEKLNLLLSKLENLESLSINLQCLENKEELDFFEEANDFGEHSFVKILKNLNNLKNLKLSTIYVDRVLSDTLYLFRELKKMDNLEQLTIEEIKGDSELYWAIFTELEELNNIKTLCLELYEINEWDKSDWEYFIERCNYLPNIKHLSFPALMNEKIYSFIEELNFKESFPNLESIHIDKLEFSEKSKNSLSDLYGIEVYDSGDKGLNE